MLRARKLLPLLCSRLQSSLTLGSAASTSSALDVPQQLRNKITIPISNNQAGAGALPTCSLLLLMAKVRRQWQGWETWAMHTCCPQVDKALKQLNRKLIQGGLTNEWKARAYFVRPAQQRVLDAKETKRRLAKKRFKATMKAITTRQARSARLPSSGRSDRDVALAIAPLCMLVWTRMCCSGLWVMHSSHRHDALQGLLIVWAMKLLIVGCWQWPDGE